MNRHKLIYDPSKHKSTSPHPRSGEHLKYFVYKEGKCYAEGLTYKQLSVFVLQRRISLGIPTDKMIKPNGILGALRELNYSYETIKADQNRIYEEWVKARDKVESLYKQELKEYYLNIDCSDETFEKLYQVAVDLCKLPPIDYEYEETTAYDKHMEFELNIELLAQIAKGYAKDLKQK